MGTNPFAENLRWETLLLGWMPFIVKIVMKIEAKIIVLSTNRLKTLRMQVIKYEAIKGIEAEGMIRVAII